MKFTISTAGKFHLFDMARQLHKRSLLDVIYTGYPRFKLKSENMPDDKIHSFTAVHLMTLMGLRWIPALSTAGKNLTWLDSEIFDRCVSANLDSTDVFIGHSGVGLHSGREAKRRGAIYVCDRGSSHIRYQNDILTSEYKRHGLRFQGVDPRVIAKEELEYKLADLIFVPSTFAVDTFLMMGVPKEKLRLIPYGVDLKRFAPAATPEEGAFEVLFVGNASIRKGIPDLIAAFDRLQHLRKRLTLIGTVDPDMEPILKRAGAPLRLRVLGHVPQAELSDHMSRSHVLALPSVEDGFGLVIGQAMACGCPVVASTNTGGVDMFRDGVEGFIVPARSADGLLDRLQLLADEPDRQSRMGRAALARVRTRGGWDRYGEQIVDAVRNFSSSEKQAIAPMWTLEPSHS